jgi:hypothetical protein
MSTPSTDAVETRMAMADSLDRPHLAEKLLGRLVQAHHGIPGVVGQQVGLDHILHPPDELGVGFGRHAPGLDDPGLDIGFLRAWRTVSVLIDLIKPRMTSSSASSCKHQWQRPWGRVAAHQLHQALFQVPLDLNLVGPGRLGAAIEGCLDALGDESLAHAGDGPRARPQGLDDLLIGSFIPISGIGEEKDAGMGQLASGRLA